MEEEGAAKRVLHENYCKTTGLSDIAHWHPAAAEAVIAADICPACGALVSPNQGHCQDCGIKLA